MPEDNTLNYNDLIKSVSDFNPDDFDYEALTDNELDALVKASEGVFSFENSLAHVELNTVVATAGAIVAGARAYAMAKGSPVKKAGLASASAIGEFVALGGFSSLNKSIQSVNDLAEINALATQELEDRAEYGPQNPVGELPEHFDGIPNDASLPTSDWTFEDGRTIGEPRPSDDDSHDEDDDPTPQNSTPNTPPSVGPGIYGDAPQHGIDEDDDDPTPHTPPDVGAGIYGDYDAHGYSSPVIIDLDEDGVEAAVDTARFFDLDGDGYKEATTWVAPDDGLLVLDLNADGTRGAGDGDINQAEEVSFALWGDYATDLQGLGAEFDDNHDGVIDRHDSVWSELKIWQDLDSDAEVDEGELKVLYDPTIHGTDLSQVDFYDAETNRSGMVINISEIALSYDDGSDFDDTHDDISVFGVTLHGLASFTKADGTVTEGGVGDVSFTYNTLGYREVETDYGTAIEFEDGQTYRYADFETLKANGAMTGNHLGVAEEWYDGVTGDEENNVVNGYSVTKSLTISGGAGDDSLTGGGMADMISGDEGADTLKGFGGNDTFFIDAADVVYGGHGYDVAIVVGGQGVILDLYEFELEAAYGSDVHDVLRGGAGNNQSYAVALHGRGGHDIIAGSYAGSVLSGDEGNDTINGFGGSDLKLGGAGNDLIRDLAVSVDGNVASDTVFGGGGDDTIEAANSADNLIFGGEGNDSITGGKGDDSINGEDGDDWITTIGSGDDTIDGGDGDDTLEGSYGDDLIRGGEGNDSIVGSRGDDWVEAGDGDDVIIQNGHTWNSSFYDLYFGGDGDDTLILDGDQNQYEWYVNNDGILRAQGKNSSGSTIFRFDTMGVETLQFSDGSTVTIDEAGWDKQTSDDYFPLSTVAHTSGDTSRARNHEMSSSKSNRTHGHGGDDYMDGNGRDDKLWGDSGDDTQQGGHGDDTLYGGGGSDSLIGDDGHPEGDDELYGESGADFMNGVHGKDWLYGGSGADTIWGGDGEDYIYSGGGNDVVFADSSSSIVDEVHNGIVLGGGNDYGVGASGHDVMQGDQGNDTLYGVGGGDHLYAGDGDDLVDGGDGDDLLVGQAGNDQLYGGEGEDTLDGWAGFDALYGGSGSDSLNGHGDDDQLYGGSGADTLDGHLGNDYLEGGKGADLIKGSFGIDAASYRTSESGVAVNLANGATSGGDAANDTLSGIENLIGSAWRDTLIGDDGHNMLSGGDHADSLDGGVGHDFLVGDSGGILNGYMFYRYHNSKKSLDQLVASNPKEIGIAYGIDPIDVAVFHGNGGAQSDDSFDDPTNFSVEFFGALDIEDTGTYAFKLGADANAELLIDGVSYIVTSGTVSNSTVDIALTEGLHQLEVRFNQGPGDLHLTFEVQVPDEDEFVEVASSGLLGDLNDSTVFQTTLDDTLIGGDGHDRMEGGFSADYFEGGDGDDTMDGGTGVDTMIGGAGDDVYVVDHASDLVTELSGDGTDKVYSSAETYTLASNVEELELLGDEDINATGNASANELTGNARANQLHGAAGDDTLSGSAGHDTLIGGVGADTLDGGDGVDLAGYDDHEAAVRVDLADLSLGSAVVFEDTFISIEGASGTDFADTLSGDSADNHLKGNGGNDTLSGRGGDDTLEGGAGADDLLGGSGSNTASYRSAIAGVTANLADTTSNAGDAQGDVYTGIQNLEGSAFADTLVGSNGTNSITGGEGGDYLKGAAGQDRLFGGEGDDHIEGNNGADSLEGGAGDDTLIGGSANDELSGDSGDDKLKGGSADDTLYGGFGDDTLVGENGDDLLVGGSGNDLFIFGLNWGNDTITDFDVAEDVIKFASAHGIDRVSEITIEEIEDEHAVLITSSEATGMSIRLDGVIDANIDSYTFVFA